MQLWLHDGEAGKQTRSELVTLAASPAIEDGCMAACEYKRLHWANRQAGESEEGIATRLEFKPALVWQRSWFVPKHVTASSVMSSHLNVHHILVPAVWLAFQLGYDSFLWLPFSPVSPVEPLLLTRSHAATLYSGGHIGVERQSDILRAAAITIVDF